MAKNSLEQIREHSIVVADTGDFELIAKYKPTDATTNPSLILQAASKPQYAKILDEAVKLGKGNLEDTMDYVYVLFGCEILKIIPGRVSTEVDARLSFDTKATVNKAKRLCELYESRNISKDRVLIKLATTWEGIKAAQELESSNVHCNMTLVFNLVQGITCAQANATLMSPFVGRIFDYYQKKKYNNPFDDPGVKSVTEIYNHCKKFGYRTAIMGASFRNLDEIKCLAGCDLLTISPALLEGLENEVGRQVPRSLDESKAKSLSDLEEIKYNEASFRYHMTMDEMAHFKLAEGIRKFVQDTLKLEELIKTKMSQVSV